MDQAAEHIAAKVVRAERAPGCLNILDFKDAVRARLMLFNDVSHYVDQPPYSEKRLSKWFDENPLSG